MSNHIDLVGRRALATVTLALLLVVAIAGSSAHAATHSPEQIDSWCQRHRVSFNHVVWGAVPGGVFGARPVAWRVAADLTVYDHCYHGGVAGYLSVYEPSVTAAGARATASIQYGYGGRWYVAPLYVQPAGLTSGGWEQFRVRTESNIGMTRDDSLIWLKFPTYVMYPNDAGQWAAGSPQHVQCQGTSCGVYGGL